ncbi:hypothetical protein BJ508DRAFT_327028 [Ascobolus immersus RN42]|uniref:PH domain-containing protein n=1 Tax=Ascobolus immersus RN42 TaxID=1160509 RepID=A0A3N4I989_ASCIM|nr:hypothetical protein BJ508DRAFT_327028 [Ascobolus immersus RN42]
MAGFFGKLIWERIFKEKAANKFGEAIGQGKNRNDPDRHPFKTYKNPPPVGCSEADVQVLRKVQRRAYRLDNMFGCGPFRVGISSLVGFVPGAGDLLDALLALMVIWTASRCKLPWFLIFRMLLNIALDFFVGLVPILGDLADATFKANTRNANLLEDHLIKRGYANSVASGTIQAGEPLAGVPPMTQMSMRANGDVDLEAGRGGIAGFGQMKNGYGRMNEKNNYTSETYGIRTGSADSTTPLDPPPAHLYTGERPAFTGQKYSVARQQHQQQQQQMKQEPKMSILERRQSPKAPSPEKPKGRNPLKRLPVNLPNLEIPGSSKRELIGAAVNGGRQMMQQPRNITARS